jgi:hypothetical protein
MKFMPCPCNSGRAMSWQMVTVASLYLTASPWLLIRDDRGWFGAVGGDHVPDAQRLRDDLETGRVQPASRMLRLAASSGST